MGYDHWTMFLMQTAPSLVVLPIGLWLCFRNRFRRPLVARLIGGAIVIELLISSTQIADLDPILRGLAKAGVFC